jgi:hypothetical protein
MRSRTATSSAFAAFLAACVLVGCGAEIGTPSSSAGAPPTSPPNSPSMREASSEAPATVQAVSPSPSRALLAPGDFAAVVTTDLVVRSAPGVGLGSEIYAGRLETPDRAYVLDGPVSADGYDWFLLDAVAVDWAPNDLPPVGWVAAAGKDGEPWITRVEPECLPQPSLGQIIHAPPELNLYCYPEVELTFEGLVSCNDLESLITGAPWDTGCWIVESEDVFGAIPQPVIIAPTDASADQAPLPGGRDSYGRFRFRAHFDDPASARCEDAETGAPDELSIYACRRLLVVSEWLP